MNETPPKLSFFSPNIEWTSSEQVMRDFVLTWEQHHCEVSQRLQQSQNGV